MKRVSASILLAVIVAPTSTAYAADKPDPRLATAQTAFVEPIDPSSDDDQAVAVCLGERLHGALPALTPASKDDAAIVLRVGATIRGPIMQSKASYLSVFHSHHATLTAVAPDGAVLWTDSTPAGRASKNAACALADKLLERLRHARQKARDGLRRK